MSRRNFFDLGGIEHGPRPLNGLGKVGIAERLIDHEIDRTVEEFGERRL